MSTITTANTITADSINSIITTASAVLSTAYGSGLISQPVPVGSFITTNRWTNLVSDLRRCWIHQTGSLSGFPTVSSLPVPGDTITANFANTLQNIAKTVNDNVYVVPPENQTQQFALASSTSTIYDGTNLTYQVDYTFTDNANANYFFNLGGRIAAGLSHASGPYIGNTAIWAGFIDWANSRISSLAYSRNQWAVSTSINASYTSSTNYTVRLGIFAKDARTIRSTLTVTNVTSTVSPPATAASPGAPTIGTATATGTTTANVSFTAPASNGGAAITTYTATSSPEGITGTLSQAGSGTINVTGLTAGTPYTFTVTATNSVGTSRASGASNSITTWAVPVNIVAPAVSGTATVGQTLTTTAGNWFGVPTPTYAYQWQRDGANISGATSSTYTLVSGDTGSAIRCVVTATNAAGSASANSNAASVVVVATAPGAPTIGTATATGTTTANVSFTAPASDGGATITTYTATSSPGGRTGTLSRAGSGTITVSGLTAGTSYTFTVTATNSVGTSSASGASNSITTRVVPVNIVAPAVFGTATVGQTLSTTNGNWLGVPTPTYAYQWQRAGVNISGATSSTYTLVSADVGSAIRCVVTATNTAGSASANSNATSSVATATTGPPTYEIIPMATSVVEGMEFTFYVTTANVPEGTELRWTYDSPISVNSNRDFRPINDVWGGGSIFINGGVGSITLTATDDGTNEGTETFIIKLFRLLPNGETELVKTSDPITIYEVSAIDPASQTYTITPEATFVGEGVTLRITVDTTNVPFGTELLWVYDSPRSGTSNPDFQDVNTRETIRYGRTIVISGSANFEIRATNDGVNEGTETFTIKLFRYLPNGETVLVKTSDPITIYEDYAYNPAL